MRWAPVVYAAVDKKHKDEQDTEQRKQKTSAKASQQSGPRFSGGMG